LFSTSTQWTSWSSHGTVTCSRLVQSGHRGHLMALSLVFDIMYS